MWILESPVLAEIFVMDNGGKRHRDGMEVNVLGSLYKGPWEKKYWSSSRGKDRYPYPVGYQAVRWHGSHSYFMEICEDKRGPCFVVSCEEGIRCMGQTPTAAWENILKKRHSGASKRSGRLSSSRINGSEMFGFTDPVVQLLLRDLMISDSGENSKATNASSSQQNDENRQNQGTSLSKICSSKVVKNLQGNVSNEKTSICGGVNQAKDPALMYGKERTLESVTVDLVGENEAVQQNACPGPKESRKKEFSQSNVHASPMFKDWPPRKRMRTRRSKRNVTPGMFIGNPEYELLQTPRVPDLEKDKVGSASAPEAASSSLKTKVIPKQDLQKAGQHIDIGAPEKPKSHDVNLHNSSSDFLVPQSPVCMCIKPAILAGDSLPNNDGEVDAAIALLTHPNGSGPSSASHCKNLLLIADKDRLCENHQSLSPNSYSDAEMENPDAILPENFVDGMVNGLGVTTVLALGHEIDLSSETVEDQLGDQHSDEGGSAQQDSRLGPAEQDFRLESAQQELKLTVSSSEDKTESDSIGQELAKSMMTLLLPKAIPLLQKGSRKWKRIRPLGDGIKHNNEKLCNLFKPHYLEGTDIDIFKDREQANEFVPDSEDRNHGTQQMPELLQGAELYVASQSIHKPENSYAIDIATGRSAHGQFEEMEAANNKVEDQEEIVNDSEGDDTPVYHKIDKDTPHAEHIEEGTIGSMHDEIKAQADVIMDSEASDHEIVPNKGVEYTEELLANGELPYAKAYEPIVCFEHQLPVMSVQLNVQNQEIYACICCGYPQKKERLLFIYQVTVTNSLESKSLLVSAMDIFLCEDPEREENRKVLQFQFEEYGMQFSPDARRLILLGCFLFPNARTSSANSAESIMSSLQVVSFRSKEPLIETKLHSEAQIRCLLVSGPHMIIAAGDDGHITGWIMDTTWRSHKEKFILPRASFKGVPFKSITRLSAVPGLSHLIVGHNCFGSFAIWDMQRKCIISSFQADLHLKRACFLNASWVSRHAMYHGINLSLKTREVCATATTKEDKEDSGDLCLFLLVNVEPEPSELSERGEEYSEPSNKKDSWVTVAVENNSIAIGNSLDKRIVVANLVGEYGVFGSEDGHVVVCEIESGKRLLELMELKGSAITHIAVEESVLGIAGSDARVVLYYRAAREEQMLTQRIKD